MATVLSIKTNKFYSGKKWDTMQKMYCDFYGQFIPKYKDKIFRIQKDTGVELLEYAISIKCMAICSGLEAQLSIGLWNGDKSDNMHSEYKTAIIVAESNLGDFDSKKWISIQSENDQLNITFRLVAMFVVTLFRKIKKIKAEVLLKLLEGKKQKQIAIELNKSQSTVCNIAKSLHWNLFCKIIKSYKEVAAIHTTK